MKEKLFFRELVKTHLRKWGFLPLILLLQLIPPYASGGLRIADMSTVNTYILTHPIKGNFAAIIRYFKSFPCCS